MSLIDIYADYKKTYRVSQKNLPKQIKDKIFDECRDNRLSEFEEEHVTDRTEKTVWFNSEHEPCETEWHTRLFFKGNDKTVHVVDWFFDESFNLHHRTDTAFSLREAEIMADALKEVA